MSEKSFSFDKKLWERFISTAQPYFFPLNVSNSSWRLLAMLTFSILFVMSLSHFGLIGIGALVEILYPTFINEVAPNFKNFVANLKSTIPLIVSSSFIVFKKKLFFCL